MRFPAVDPRQSFPAMEQQVLERWRERDVFAESVRRREGGTPYVFYEGPPTANGRPGSHHVLARVFKDIYPRYKTMQGHHVLRKGGWDCHGLPVEIAVENKLGFTNKNDIEAYGIAEFNAECRGSVLEFLEDWKALTERIGFWVDLDTAYATMDTPFVESVWWALSQLHERDLLYEGYKVVPYCTRCGTALSSHEVSLGYKDVEDPSVYVKFPIADGSASLLVWTTTPWTLVSNAAVAVDPALTYVRASLAGEVFILAEALVERVLGEDAEIVDRFPGEQLVGTRYAPPFDFLNPSEWKSDKVHTVLPGDFVSDEDGTGIVHTAIAFGEDDFRLGAEQGIAVVNPVRRDGTYDDRIGPYAGRWVKDADDDLVEDLRARGRLFRTERYLHSYPHCWRDGTPLLYYAKPSWFVRTTALRDELLAANESVTWHPPHIKHGRFGKWLENNVDWAISRERYWGTPLPIWRNAAGETVAVSSLADLAEKSGVTIDDPHRPYVDDVEIPSPTGGEPLRRTPEVIDVWFDSGSMPFAQWGAPHTGEADFARDFPADYICEALDQTRGWFYSLLAVNTLLFGRAPYKDVVCLGLILDQQGEKMSKSKGNIVAPWEVLDAYGADAFRWYFFTSKHPWDGYQFSVDAVGDAMRQFLLQLWNTYGFYTLYANAAGDAYERTAPKTPLDRWAISRLRSTEIAVTNGLEAYDATTAGRAIAEFVDDLSNWYVRLSRRRFWDGDPAAFATLHECLLTVAKLLAPFCPFVADELYEGLDGTEPSVHLCDWPTAQDSGDGALLKAMDLARATVEMGRAARAQAKVKNRQPLPAAVIVADGDERAALETLADLVRDELNVKALRFVDEAAQLGSYEVKANYRTLGPRFGKHMPQAAAAVAALDAAHVTRALREGRTVGVNVDGQEHELTGNDLQLAMQPLEGYQVERAGSHAVALDLHLSDELRREGLARELVHAIQAARKDAGLDVSDRVALTLVGDADTLSAVRAHKDYIAGEVLATSVTLVDGNELAITVAPS